MSADKVIWSLRRHLPIWSSASAFDLSSLLSLPIKSPLCSARTPYHDILVSHIIDALTARSDLRSNCSYYAYYGINHLPLYVFYVFESWVQGRPQPMKDRPVHQFTGRELVNPSKLKYSKCTFGWFHICAQRVSCRAMQACCNWFARASGLVNANEFHSAPLYRDCTSSAFSERSFCKRFAFLGCI